MIPDVIYLQIIDEFGEETDPLTIEVTWCADQINDSDIKYVREEKQK